MQRRAISIPEVWTPGDRLEARKLDQPGHALRALAHPDGPRVELQFPAPLDQLGMWRKFDYKGTNGDYILAVPSDNTSGSQVPIAKPEMLRPSVTSHGGHTFTFNNDYERTTGGETQVVVPSLDTDDEIWAVNVPTGLTTVSPQTVGLQVNWLWINVDGRMWAADV